MANFKNITELPVVESADGLKLIVNDDGAAKQIAASAVGAQADFSVTDETHPGFIKNKPEMVKTVNDVEPDDNGNVEIEIPEGFSGSWNDLKDKPFYEESSKIDVIPMQTVTLDGDSVVLTGIQEYHIGMTINVLFDGVVYKTEIKDGWHNGDNYIVSFFTLDNDIEMKIVWDGTLVDEHYLPILLVYQGELTGDHTISAYFEDSVVHKLDSKYIQAYYISDTGSGYIGNEEVYNALLAFNNNPTIGFPNITIKDNSGHLCKAVGIRHVPDEGGGYASLKGFRISYCYHYGDFESQRIVIAPTQKDANSVESQDMA